MTRRLYDILLVRGIGRPRLVIGKNGDSISILCTVSSALMLINERYHLSLLFLRLVSHHGLYHRVSIRHLPSSLGNLL
jgi:hypothetical protein